MAKIGILGSGTWGSALANLLSSKGHLVTLYSKFDEERKSLEETHKHPHLPGSILNDSIVFTSNLQNAIEDKEFIVFASPSVFIRDGAKEAKWFLKPGQIIVNVAKGIEKDSLLTMSEVIEDELGPSFRVVALCGPTHAEEVAKGLPTLITASSKNEEAAKKVQEAFSYGEFRVYTNNDPKGVEICAALKNIIALACGISDGLGYGDNAKAAIITRGLSEMMRLGSAMGCEISTFFGLSGIGDIVVTSISNFSRNHNAGLLFGKGEKLKDVLPKIGMVVEGVNSLESAKQLESKYNVEMPIIDAVYGIVFENLDPREAVRNLFNRKLRQEHGK